MAIPTSLDFVAGSIEFRSNSDGVAIYGTTKGLRRLASLIYSLANEDATTEHIHLEDYELLTASSVVATVIRVATD